MGLTALYYTGPFEAGGAASGAAWFTGSSTLLTALAGAKLDPERHARFDLLFEGGAETFYEIGSDLFETPLERREVTLPYLGVRGGLSALIGRSSRFVFGAWWQGGSSVGRKTVVVPVESCLFDCSTENRRITVGGPSWSLGLRFGGQIFVD